jgi:hypothetical protein
LNHFSKASSTSGNLAILHFNILKDYSPDQIYNADETGLFFRLLPDKTFEFKDVKCHGGKQRQINCSCLLQTCLVLINYPCSLLENHKILVVSKMLTQMFYQATNEKIAQFHQHSKSDQVSSLLRCLKVYFSNH